MSCWLPEKCTLDVACASVSAGQVGLGLPFARWLLPRIKQYFPDFPDRSAEELYEAENVIREPLFD